MRYNVGFSQYIKIIIIKMLEEKNESETKTKKILLVLPYSNKRI